MAITKETESLWAKKLAETILSPNPLFMFIERKKEKERLEEIKLFMENLKTKKRSCLLKEMEKLFVDNLNKTKRIEWLEKRETELGKDVDKLEKIRDIIRGYEYDEGDEE